MSMAENEFDWGLNYDDGEDGEISYSQPIENNEPQSQEQQIVNENDDIVTKFLKLNGISDVNSIKFEDDNGLVTTKSWNDLTEDEQLNILSTSHNDPDVDLDDNEIAIINDMRSRGMTPEQYLNTVSQLSVQNYLKNQQKQLPYTVDGLDDDSVYLIDLQNKIPDITEDEALKALEAAKANPEFYARQITGIRNDLKQREEAYYQSQQAETDAQNQQAFETFKNSVLDNIESLNKFGDLEINLQVEDMEDLASYILDQDETGVTPLGRDLNNPAKLVELAWFATKGQDAFNSLSEYVAEEIKKVRQASYDKGFADGQSKKLQSPKVVYLPVNNRLKTQTYLDLN